MQLHKLRDLKKMTQEEVAKAIGVSRITYVRWENRTTGISEEYMRKLAAFYGERPTDLKLKHVGRPIVRKRTLFEDARPLPHTLRWLREDNGYTQAEAAGYFGVSRNTYIGWERHVHATPSKHKPMFRRLFGELPTDLVFGTYGSHGAFTVDEES